MGLRDLDWPHALILLAVAVGIVYVVGASAGQGKTAEGTVAEIPVTGSIMPGDGFSSGSVTPDGVRTLVRKAQKDGADAFMFVINSGGGSVVASKDMKRVIADIKEPTTCLMKDLAASGAYWAATACDTIVADPLTMTGSIGVRSTYLEFSGLLNRLGIEYVNLTAGRLKDAGSQYKNLTEAERRMLQDHLDAIHQAFIRDVAQARGLNVSYVEQYATGEPLLGREAERIGLVDRLGGREEALAYLENATNRSLQVKEYRGMPSFNLLSLLTTKLGQGIGRALTQAFGPEATRRLLQVR
ncbi:MAG: S49 family peptidase [Candidatus Nanohaloarchaea archaeon]|nr:S49 family peptidase [Candidatus Nanohaloarchaea archaeon]